MGLMARLREWRLPARYNSNVGAGDWLSLDRPVSAIVDAAEDWKRAFEGIEKPWLCWNVNEHWCRLQQRLVREVGWTPIVGMDPRYPPPKLEPGAVLVDFNARLKLPFMFFHFPLEFVFLFADRLAFWHSDLLCRRANMQYLATAFDQLPDGEMAAVLDIRGRRNLLCPRQHRFWELAGCTTRGASASQWRSGAGWWRPFDLHPNCPSEEERRRRRVYVGDHGFGIMFWKRYCGGVVHELELRRLLEGHCTSINRPEYLRLAPDGPARDMGREIEMNFAIEEVARRLGIEDLLDNLGDGVERPKAARRG